MKLLSYDIEIYNELPEGKVDFSEIIPSVAAIGTNKDDVKFYYDLPYMTKETAKKLCYDIYDYYKQGCVPFTWNGCFFDLQLLGIYSGEIELCAELALNHIDGMLLVTFNKGYYLGLDTALVGFGLETKMHTVTLNNGEQIQDMTGAKAPQMWRDGEIEAVKYYLYGDVVQPLKLAEKIEQTGKIQWTSKTGNPMFLRTPLMKVKDLFDLPCPDVSWMNKDPNRPIPTRKQFVEWMPEKVLTKYGIVL